MKFKKDILPLISLFALALPTAALADDVQVLDEISVTASRVETKTKEAPVTINIIDEDELDTVKFVDSEKELLQRIPGASMIRNLRIPMGSKNYTVNLIDGMSVNTFGSGVQSFANDTSSLDIKRIEILRGPSSVLYGSNAIGGVINVITRDAPLEPEYKVWGEGGQYSRKRGGASAAGTVNGFGYFVDTNFLDSDNWQDRSRNDRRAISSKITKDLTDNSLVTLRAEYLDVLLENPGTLTQAQFDADWSQAGVTDAYNDEQRLTLSGTYEVALTDKSELKVAYSLRDHVEAGPPSYSASGAFGDNHVANQNLIATYRHDFDFYRSRAIFGIDLQKSASDDKTYNGRTDDSGIDSRWGITAKVKSPFVQFEISPLEKLRLTMGARHDSVKYNAIEKTGTGDAQSHYSNVTRKIGATWQLDDSNNLWAGFSEGFVVPSRTYLFTTSRYIPNPNLQPERAENWEAGLRGRLFNKRMKYDLALYHTTMRDFVVIKDQAGQDGVTNVGKVEFKGVEASGAYLATDYLKFAGAYTYARNKFIDYIDGATDYSGNDLSSSPKHHVNLRATWMPLENLELELAWNKISNYFTHDNNDADPDGKASRPGIFTLRASYDMGPWSFWGHAHNLLNTKYAERVSYSTSGGGSRSYTSGEGLNIYAGLSYNW
ncbi:MAG: TonB-dependent receptor [Rhodospirillales bacterium]|nr:TonB-dependent receptor [Rhodospirillales bacterium]